MKQERIIWSGGINRSLDPRHLQNHEQYDAYNLEVLERGSSSKRKGFGRWRTNNNTFPDTVRGVALMYDSDGNRYLFVFSDGIGAGSGTDVWIEKAGLLTIPLVIEDFFPSKGNRVRAAVFGDRIYFANGVDRPRWYKEYIEPPLGGHVWGIAGVPSPAQRAWDMSSFDYFISRAIYADCITSSEDLGIDPPGIWRYKQTIGYYGKGSDEQIEESNAGPASPMFHCQFNMAEALSVALEGYVEKGIPIGIADFDDLILDANESGGQDYENEIRWMRMHRQHKMFSDELYSPFEFLVEMKKGWPTSISDVYHRDSAIVAPTTRVSIPVSHHIENANNRLFLGRVEKELFTQPGLPNHFRGFSPPGTTYKPNFSYRMSITIQNTNAKTLTGVVIPLRFTDQTDAGQTATPPSGGGNWTGAYLNTSLDLAGTTDGWWQMVFVDEDGITSLGFFRVGTVQVGGYDTVTFLVEIPEIAAGGSRTIYLYFEDSELVTAGNPESHSGEVGHWESLAHYRLLESSHGLLIDFENWEPGMAVTDITQKRSLGKIGEILGDVAISSNMWTRFFGDNSKFFGNERSLLLNNDAITDARCTIPFWTNSTGLTKFSFVFAIRLYTSTPSAGNTRARILLRDRVLATTSVQVDFQPNDASTMNVIVTVYDTDATSYSLTLTDVSYTDTWLYFLVQVEADNFRVVCVKNGNTGHPGEGAAWGDTGSFTTYSNSRSDIAKPIQFFSDNEFCSYAGFVTSPEYTIVRFKEIEFTERLVEGADELIQMSMHDSYWVSHGLATAGDRESQTGEKRPDRMYFSRLNQPNSFEAIDFRDMGELGRPIQGIKSIRNRLFVFDENKIRALFSAGSERALALVSGDTTMWNLSQDLTGEIGGLGVLAPDSLVSMEFAGQDGIGFLSKRGFYFFDGSRFTHISEKVDSLIYDEDVSDDYRRLLTAHFLKKKRQLILGMLSWGGPVAYRYWMLAVDMKFAQDAAGMVWSRWNSLINYGVELDFNIDTGEFVYVNHSDPVHTTRQILKLEGNTGADTYKDISEDELSGVPVEALAMSKQFDVFDAELLKCDLHTSGDAGYSVELRVLKDSLSAGAGDVVKSGVTNGLYRFPIGTHAKAFLFQLFDETAFRCVFEKLDFYFNVHGERRLNA